MSVPARAAAIPPPVVTSLAGAVRIGAGPAALVVAAAPTIAAVDSAAKGRRR